MNKQPRRHVSGADKVAILKRHLLDKVPVSDLCEELGLQVNQFYHWQQQFFENGHAAFENGRKSKTVEDAQQKKIEQLEANAPRRDRYPVTKLECALVERNSVAARKARK